MIDLWTRAEFWFTLHLVNIKNKISINKKATSVCASFRLLSWLLQSQKVSNRILVGFYFKVLSYDIIIMCSQIRHRRMASNLKIKQLIWNDGFNLVIILLSFDIFDNQLVVKISSSHELIEHIWRITIILSYWQARANK